MIAVDDTVAIFQSIDWSQCREAVFDCFSTFFGLLDVGAQIDGGGGGGGGGLRVSRCVLSAALV
jgi:hypothetical protein